MPRKRKNYKTEDKSKVNQKGKPTTPEDSKPSSDDMSKEKHCNDISWYAQDAQLLADSASLPWSTQTGIVYHQTVKFSSSSHDFEAIKHESIPGIFTQRLALGIGKTRVDIEAANVSANAIYTFIRHLNSGHANYDAPDLMDYLIQMDYIFSAINYAQRIYGTVFAYNVFNRYTPDALLRAQNIDPASIKDNIVGFRTRLNMIIKQAATLVVPNNLPIYFRHSWLFQNYYIEGTDIKDQIYMYVPSAFHVLKLPADSPAYLTPMTWHDTTGQEYKYLNADVVISAFELLDRIQEMVSQLYLSEDYGIMAGDILKAYGEGGIMRLSECPEMYVTPIVPNNEVLLQMKNSVTPRCVAAAASANLGWGDIRMDPDTNEIFWNTQVSSAMTTAWSWMKQDVMVNNVRVLTLEGSPSPAMNMIMTRNIPYIKLDEIGGMIFSGTEIPMENAIWYYDWDEATGNTMLNHEKFTSILIYDGGGMPGSWARVFALLSNFKYHPAIYIGITSASSDTFSIHRVFQVDNFTYLTDDELDRMHAVAIMSEFNIPSMALVK